MKHKTLSTKDQKGKLLSIILFALFCSFNIYAQNTIISGNITSEEDGFPLPGVTILIKNTNKGEITDFDGNYTIEANKGDILIYSYLGLITQQITVNETAQINIILKPDENSLDEVVVVGYGTVKKKEITGALTQLKSDDLESIVTSDVGSALQGQVAGVNIVASELPGGDSEILIRGISTLAEGQNEPLYVVDGIIQDGNPRIPPTDIESLTVLKDAASTAIYGVRGGTGVILITTKQGKPGTLRVRTNASYAIQQRNSAVPLMNSVEQTYFDIVSAANVNNTTYDQVNLQLLQQPASFVNETDLNDLVFNDQAATQTYNINISGGTDDITYNVGLGLYDQGGLQINSAFNRFNMRANTVYSKNKLRIQSSLAFVTEDRDIPQGNLLSQAIVYRPTQNGLDINNIVEELNQDGDDVNRLGWVLESLRTTNNLKRNRISGAVTLNYELIDGLNLQTNLSLTKISDIGKIIRPYQVIYNNSGLLQSEPENSYIDSRTIFRTNIFGNIGATYEKELLEDQTVTFTFFTELEDNSEEAFSARRAGVTFPGSTTLDLATGTQSVGSYEDVEKRFSLLGRIQYNYKDKYILSSGVRNDRSTNFGLEYNSGIFPNIALAWNVHEENFWENYKSAVNSFRVRASYGEIGNDRISPYNYIPSLVQNINYFGTNGDTGTETINLGTIQQDFANEILTWETTAEKNLGLDLGFLKNKITLTADYYYRKKVDMLFPILIPPSAGGGENASLILNVGNMVNAGLELGASYRAKLGNVNINMNGTFTTNKNEITKINGDTEFIENNTSVLVGRAPDQSRITRLAVGYPAASFFLYQTDGIIDTEEKLAAYQKIVSNAKMGDTRFIDNNNDGTIDDNDRAYSGSGLPEYELGYTFEARYKNFDFSMNWYAALGQEVMNGFDAWAYGFGRHKDQVYQWSPANPETSIPAYQNDIRRHPNYRGNSDLYLEDGSYVRLRQASLGYNIPKKRVEKWGLDYLRFYVRVQNPLTLTKYSGYNPEVGGGILSKGLDSNTGPISKMYMLGLNLNF
ncbi:MULTISPECIES: SusC/RagA family TonB-linked outer membrane protein [unclassified Lacinutrix]